MARLSDVAVSGVFISHSSIDEELVSKFVDLIEGGIGVGGDHVFASSVAGRDPESSVTIRDRIREQIAEAGAVVFLVSPTFYASPFCSAELGAAIAYDKPMFLFAVPPFTQEDLASTLGDMLIADLADPESLDKFNDFLRSELGVEEKIRRWGRQRDRFSEWLAENPAPDHADEAWRDRGRWDGDIVDGTLYIGNGYMRANHAETIVRTIEQKRVLPTVYAYLTNAGYQNWINLTQDPRYRYFHDAVSLYTNHARELAEKVTQAVGGTNLDVISLGCGNGVKDQQLLRALAHLGSARGLYYYPFDINPSMISTAMQLVGGDEDLSDIKVKAILAEFDSLPQFYKIYQYREGPNVLMLLGNTLGNLPDERDFLGRIHDHAMKSGDLFLLDVRNQNSDDDPERELGTIRLNKRFDFGPLDMLSVPYDEAKLTYDSPPGRPSKVDGTQTVRARYEECKIKTKTYKNITLSYIHRYNPASLEALLRDVGFQVLQQFDEGMATSFLLQKAR